MNYSYFEQMKDILPSMGIAIIMGISILVVMMLHLSNWLTLIIQIMVGVLVYWLLSEIFKLECYLYLKNMILKFLNNRKGNEI